MTFSEHKRDAIESEMAGRWQAAAEEWDAARRRAWDKATRALATKRRDEALARAGASPATTPTKSKAQVASESAKAPVLEARESARAAAAGLKHGHVVQHVRRGVTVAKCTWIGPRQWLFGDTTYPSISAAANAAAEAIGMKSRTLCGWLFWGVETRAGKPEG